MKERSSLISVCIVKGAWNCALVWSIISVVNGISKEFIVYSSD
jgi:hypothetical protein